MIIGAMERNGVIVTLNNKRELIARVATEEVRGGFNMEPQD